jgi:hypothetical protein
MGKLFSAPKTPQEDPQITALRNAEQKRAEDDRLRATQDQLRLETRIRNNTFGLRSLFGSLTSNRAARSLFGAG